LGEFYFLGISGVKNWSKKIVRKIGVNFGIKNKIQKSGVQKIKSEKWGVQKMLSRVWVLDNGNKEKSKILKF
jgi:hypothetical protein